MIVVDANILIYRMVECEKTNKTFQLEEFDPEWRFPPLWEYEFGNALALMVRQKTMSSKDAAVILKKALDLFASGAMGADPDLALRLAVHHQLTFYASQYLALAQALGVPLVTEDKGLRRAGAGTAVSMEEFLN